MKGMEFGSRKNLYKKYGLYTILVILVAVCNYSGLVPQLFSLDAMVMLSLCVSIALYEKSIPGMVFGILCGALWDLGTTQADGYYTVVLAAVGFISGSLSTFFLRNNILSCLLLTFVSAFTSNVGHWALFYLRKGYDGAVKVFFEFYLPSAVYCLAFGAILYYIVGYIHKETKQKKKH